MGRKSSFTFIGEKGVILLSKHFYTYLSKLGTKNKCDNPKLKTFPCHMLYFLCQRERIFRILYSHVLNPLSKSVLTICKCAAIE